MNFSTDRDLLALEPALFHDVPWVGQQRVEVDDAAVMGTTVLSPTADFVGAQVEAGGVVLIERVAHEVVRRLDASSLEVSLLRTRLAEPAIPGPFAEDGDEPTGRRLVVRTFGPQAAMVHDSLLRLLGIDLHDARPGALGEDAVVSLSVMVRLETLGTLERVFSGAAALTGDNQMLLYKAGEYRRRFRQATAQASVLLDTNGDGHADERRRLGIGRLVRV